MASQRFGPTGIHADIANTRRRVTIARQKLATATLSEADRAHYTMVVEWGMARLADLTGAR